MRQTLIEYGLVFLAGALYAVALKYFVLPSKVILTGTEGIATALSYYFDSYWLFIGLYVLFQSALLLFAFARVSRVFAQRSLLVVSTVVVGLAVLPELRFAQQNLKNERIILVLFGGLLAGVAKALAFRNRGSTGDEDILGAYFAVKYLKPVGSIAIIAAIGSTTFGLVMDLIKNGQFESVVNTLMYTCIYIFASAETLNNLYRKFKITMLAIITRNEKRSRHCDHDDIRTSYLYIASRDRRSQRRHICRRPHDHYTRRAPSSACRNSSRRPRLFLLLSRRRGHFSPLPYRPDWLTFLVR